MELKFTTKRDQNGNRKMLIVNLETKEMEYGSGIRYYDSDFIEISATKRRDLIDDFKAAGFQTLIRL